MKAIYKLRFLNIGIFTMLFSFSAWTQVNTLASRIMSTPTSFPTGVPFEYTVGCNAIMPYLSDPNMGKSSYVSVSVVETGITNYISLEHVNACLKQSKQRYWDFYSSNSLRVNDVIKTSAQSNSFYMQTDNIVFCGRVGNNAALFVADKDFNVARNAAGNPILPVYFGEDYREFYSIAEIPGQGYVVCGETQNKQGVLLYVDYSFQIVNSFRSSAVLTKVIYDEANFKIVLLGVSDVTSGSHGEICIYSMRPYSSNILASHSYKTQFSWNNCVFPGNWEYSTLYKTNLILLNDKNSIALTLTSPENFPGINGVYQSFLHIANIDGSNSEDYMFSLYDGSGQDKAFVSDIQTFDENIYYILLHAYTPLGNTGTKESSVILEAARGNIGAWKGLKIESNNPSPYHDLLLDKMFKRKNCNQLVIAGNENKYPQTPQTQTQLYYTEVKTPLDLSVLHPFEYSADLINVVPYNPIIGTPVVLNSGFFSARFSIPTNVDPNIPTRNPDQYFQGSCCDNLATSKVNIHANRKMNRPTNFPVGMSFDYNVGCNAIAPYTKDIRNDKDTYVSVSVVETGTRNYISMEQLYACLDESRQRYWNFSSGDSLRINDVIHVLEEGRSFYSNADNITFCGRIGNKASLFIADKNFNVATDINGNYIYPARFDDYQEFYSIAEIPGMGYVVCGETRNKTGILLYVDYTFQPIATYECPAVFGKVIYNQPDDKVILMGIHHRNNYDYEICIYSVRPYSNMILASHSFNLQNSSLHYRWWNRPYESYGNYFLADLILLNDNNSIALTATNTEDFPGVAAGSYETFLHIAKLDGTPISDHIFNVCGMAGGALGEYKGFASAIQTFDEKTYYILLNHHQAAQLGISSNRTDTISGSVIVEADLNNNQWEGLKVEPDFASSWHDEFLQFRKMFKREGCNKLVMAGDVNIFSMPSSLYRVHYAEIESPLNLGALHPFEYKVGMVLNAPYSPSIGSVPNINNGRKPSMRRVRPVVDRNIPMLIPNYYYPGNCIYTCSAIKSYGKILSLEENDLNKGSDFFHVLQNKIQLENADAYKYYRIYDILGRLQQKGNVNSNNIEYSNLPKGIYILQLFKKSGESQTFKFKAQ